MRPAVAGRGGVLGVDALDIAIPSYIGLGPVVHRDHRLAFIFRTHMLRFLVSFFLCMLHGLFTLSFFLLFLQLPSYSSEFFQIW